MLILSVLIRVLAIEEITYNGEGNEARVKAAIGPNLKITVIPVQTYQGSLDGPVQIYQNKSSCSMEALREGETGERIISKGKDGRNYIAGHQWHGSIKKKTWEDLRQSAPETAKLRELQADCEKQGLIWDFEEGSGRTRTYNCYHKSNDAGKACNSSLMCEGRCLANLDQTKNLQLVRAEAGVDSLVSAFKLRKLRKTLASSGQCSRWREVRNCHRFVEKGRVTEVTCLSRNQP